MPYRDGRDDLEEIHRISATDLLCAVPEQACPRFAFFGCRLARTPVKIRQPRYGEHGFDGATGRSASAYLQYRCPLSYDSIWKPPVRCRPVLLSLPLGFACGRHLVDHRGVDHGSIDSSDVIFANVASLKRGGTEHRHVGFAKSHDRGLCFRQIVLPKRLAIHPRIGRICIQLAKCAGDSF